MGIAVCLLSVNQCYTFPFHHDHLKSDRDVSGKTFVAHVTAMYVCVFSCMQ